MLANSLTTNDSLPGPVPDQPMRVAIVAPEFPPEFGGMQTYACEFARELARRGTDVTVFTSVRHAAHRYDEPFPVIPSLNFRRWLDRPVLCRERARFDCWHVMTAAYAWLALDSDRVLVSVHGNDFLDPPPVGCLDVRQRLGLPFGSSLDFQFGKWNSRRLLKQSFRRVRHVLANSRYTEQEFLRHHSSCRGRTTVACCGIPDRVLDRPLPRRDSSKRCRFVTVSRLDEPRKNIDMVIQALGQLREEHEFEYHVIGDGIDRPRLERLAHDMGIGERVVFRGYLSSEELQSGLAAADLFVLTSSTGRKSYEGFGICYLEANAAGTPVLAARTGGAIDAVEENVSGYFVDEPGPGQIAEALSGFLSGKRRFTAEHCREFAASFRWSRVVDRALPAYALLTAPGSRMT